MYWLLSGPSGVGKSTALSRTLALLKARPGGFRTGFTPDRSRLCLWPAWRAPDWSSSATVAWMEGGSLRAEPAAFDRLGAAILAESLPWARVLLLDELGWLEAEAAVFQEAVCRCLKGPVPVLGVIKDRRAGTWLEKLEKLPGGTILRVDPTNRDGLPAHLAEELRRGMEITGESWDEG